MRKVYYFSAKWCGPCKTLKPMVATIAMNATDIDIIDIDVDEDASVGKDHGVYTIPTLIDASNPNHRFSGVIPRQQLTQWFEEVGHV